MHVIWVTHLGMRQNVIVQQAMQPLLQCGLVSVLQMCNPDQSLSKVSEEYLSHGAVHFHSSHADCLGQGVRELIAQPLTLCCWPAGLHATEALVAHPLQYCESIIALGIEVSAVNALQYRLAGDSFAKRYDQGLSFH